MSTTLNYALNIQRIDADNAIRNQADVTASILLPGNTIGDDTFPVINNEQDHEIPLLHDFMDFIFVETDREIVLKFSDINGTPFTIRKDGAMLVDAKNITSLFVSNTSGVTAYVRVLQALRQSI